MVLSLVLLALLWCSKNKLRVPFSGNCSCYCSIPWLECFLNSLFEHHWHKALWNHLTLDRANNKLYWPNEAKNRVFMMCISFMKNLHRRHFSWERLFHWAMLLKSGMHCTDPWICVCRACFSLSDLIGETSLIWIQYHQLYYFVLIFRGRPIVYSRSRNEMNLIQYQFLDPNQLTLKHRLENVIIMKNVL